MILQPISINLKDNKKQSESKGRHKKLTKGATKINALNLVKKGARALSLMEESLLKRNFNNLLATN